MEFLLLLFMIFLQIVAEGWKTFPKLSTMIKHSIGNFLAVSEKFRQNLRIDAELIDIIEQTIGKFRNILPN